MMTLLSGTARLGLALRLTDLPAWAPPGGTGVFLEGGEYTFDGGAWDLDLTVSRAANQGYSLKWSEFPSAWAWSQWSPDIQWQDLAGVAAPPTTGALAACEILSVFSVSAYERVMHPIEHETGASV